MFPRRRPRRTLFSRAWSDEEVDAFAYEVLSFRELEQDAKLWQTPSLAMTAQAFLLTIAFNPDVALIGRLFTAGLATIVSLSSMHLMWKHRFLAQLDRTKMADLERRIGLPGIVGRRWGLSGPKPRFGSSYVVWQLALAAFALAGIVGVTVAVVNAGWIPLPDVISELVNPVDT